MKFCMFRVTRHLQAIAVAGAIGLASASGALAQQSPAKKGEPSPPASKPADVKGVVVQAPRKADSIAPEKRAALDAEAANRQAWKNYRAAPRATGTMGSRPGQSPRTEGYPGLRSWVYH